jgi:predicted GH43/DUF377 family glycosyl hydrolase
MKPISFWLTVVVLAGVTAQGVSQRRAAPTGHRLKSSAIDSDRWQLGPFVKQDRDNPVLAPNGRSVMTCPMRHQRVAWQAKLAFNPAAVVRNGRVYLLYRAQGEGPTSRIGLATSADGVHFHARPQPVLFPDNDAMRPYEWPGGCEDPRVVEDGRGNYLMYYTAYNGKVPRLAVATSRNLIAWTKRGIAFRDLPFRDEATKSAAVVCRRVGARFVAAKVNGRYWMYLRDSRLLAATSGDLIHWRVVDDADGRPRVVFGARPGHFDSQLVEPGPQAWLRRDGILLLYNGVNAQQENDPALPAGAFSGGQILFDPHNPMRIRRRSERNFIRPDRQIEREGVTPNVCFLEGLVRFKGAWRLYYGAADTRIAVAACTASIPVSFP